jgi:thioredoxin-dependent peroxiredoxin
MSSPGVGDPAPDFKLPGTPPGGGVRDYTLSEFIGQPVVLAFYPGDETSVCTKQLTDYNDGLDAFNELDAQILGVSPQGLESHERFSAKHGFKFPLLADTDKAVAREYGTLGPIGFPRRSVFIVDGGGTIRYAHRAIAGLTFRPASELIDALRELR